jgi:hypothetical protein
MRDLQELKDGVGELDWSGWLLQLILLPELPALVRFVSSGGKILIAHSTEVG